MKLAWLIFRKDMRRLWWEVAVTTGALVYLSYLDAQRYDFIPGPMDGLLNLVIPAAWAYIIGLAVLQEPLAGDREFWRTRPYPRWSLLAAKGLFVIVCVHLPYLGSCIAVLAAHGFSPIDGAAQLATNQVAVAALVSIPALGLATVSRNLPQFIIASITTALCGFLVVTQSLDASWASWAIWAGGATKNRIAAIGFASAVALLVAGLQFLKTRTGYARTLAATGAITAVALCGLLPRDPMFVERPLERRFKLNLKRATYALSFPTPSSSFGIVTDIPLELSGSPRDLSAGFTESELKITTGSGREIRAEPPPAHGSLKPEPLRFFLYPESRTSEGSRAVLRITSQRADADLTSGPVRLTGSTVVWFYENQAPSILSVGGEVSATSIGRCRAALEDMPNAMWDAKLAKVYCESPRSLPRSVRVEMKSRAGGSWKQRLSDSMPNVPYFWNTWLSPLNRGQTFFQITGDPSNRPGDQWLVKRAALESAWIELTPVKAIGQQHLTFHFDGIRLK